jgi:hypothetical protein
MSHTSGVEVAGSFCDDNECTKIALVLVVIIVVGAIVLLLTFVGTALATTWRLRQKGWNPWPARGIGLVAGFGALVVGGILSVMIPVVPVLGLTAIACPVWAGVERRRWRRVRDVPSVAPAAPA